MQKAENNFPPLHRLEHAIFKAFPDEFQELYKDESIEDKAIRLMRYAAELQKCGAYGARKVNILEKRIKRLKKFLIFGVSIGCLALGFLTFTLYKMQ